MLIFLVKKQLLIYIYLAVYFIKLDHNTDYIYGFIWNIIIEYILK